MKGSLDVLVRDTRQLILQRVADLADRHGLYELRASFLQLTNAPVAEETSTWMRALGRKRIRDARGKPESKHVQLPQNQVAAPSPALFAGRDSISKVIGQDLEDDARDVGAFEDKSGVGGSGASGSSGVGGSGLLGAPLGKQPGFDHFAVGSPRPAGAVPLLQGGGFEALVEAAPGDAAPIAATDGPPSQSSARPRVEPQRVSMGLAEHEAPRRALKDRTLAKSSRYLLWVEISPRAVPGSLSEVAPLTELQEGDVIDVIAFPFRGQLALEGPRHGRVKLLAAGNQVLQAAWTGVPEEPGRPTLFFALQTPAKAGRFGMRCNLYCRGVLLQSHLVRVEVTARARKQAHALDRELDYNLSESLDTSRLPPESACRVSWFLNDDGDGTHSFRFVSSKAGVPEHVGDAHVDGVQLQEMVQYAREALRWAAWGTKQPWTPGLPCRFADRFERDALKPVLIELAMRGANLWMEIAAQFAFVGDTYDSLRELMRTPGQVQIALKKSIGSVIPMALIYDYPLDAAVPPAEAKVCETAFDAIAAGRPLVDEPCFNGACPHYGADDVVCPGGFWGFRHDLGLPLHLPKGQVAAVIPRGDGVRAFAPISTDQAFVMRDPHLAQLTAQLKMPLEILRDRDACLDRLKEARQLVYFYCHGGLTAARTPYLQVGALGSRNIVAQSLVNARISWRGALRPLVILNGCHTTAASPDEMFSMLTAFATHCNAAGVIGTEITNFELIAGIFGSELLRNFLGSNDKDRQLGRAVRLGRLALLAKGNPLGLMYIPFALPSLQLE